MADEFNEAASKEAQFELAKSMLGEDIYEMSHRFPTIHIINDKENYSFYNIESFITYTKTLQHIADSCGKDMTLLSAELFKLYELVQEDPDDVPQNNKEIAYFCSKALANLSLALTQCNNLIEKLDNYDKEGEVNVEIHGREFCFIVMMLDNLFNYYSMFAKCLMHKRYIDKAFIDSLQERISFTISEEMEVLRSIFNVVECYKALEANRTIH